MQRVIKNEKRRWNEKLYFVVKQKVVFDFSKCYLERASILKVDDEFHAAWHDAAILRNEINTNVIKPDYSEVSFYQSGRSID